MTVLRAGGATDTGLVRPNNQDELLIDDRLFAVADGMGGHVGGEVASRTAIEALRDGFPSGPDTDGPSAEDLRTAVRLANQAVFERSQAGEELRGMGTTMTAAALVVEDGEERLAVANVGDSRAYVFAQGDLTQLSEDHSVPEELVRIGELEPEEVATHPQRHMLTRVLGIFADVDVDLWEVVPLVGDRLLLCSDGLCRELTDDQIASVLRRLANPADAVRELISRARASGGSDNITAVVIDVVDDGGRSLAASQALAGEPPGIVTLPRSEPGEREETAKSAGAKTAAPGAEEKVTFGHRKPRRRRITPRVVAFVLVLLVALGVAASAIGFYARGSYFVGLGRAAPGQPAPIVIYRGRPGGLLWFQPTVAERTQATTAQVLGFRVTVLRAGHITPSKAGARAYVANLVDEASSANATAKPSTLPTLPPPPVGATSVP